MNRSLRCEIRDEMELGAIQTGVTLEPGKEYKIIQGVYSEKRSSEEQILEKREKSLRTTSQRDIRKPREHGVREGLGEENLRKRSGRHGQVLQKDQLISEKRLLDLATKNVRWKLG